MKFLSVFAALAAVCNADISVSRSFDKVAPGNKVVLLASPGCGTTDQYGSNDCDFKWGQALDVSINGTLAQDLTSTAKFEVDAKLDNIIPLKFSCAVCGQNCSFEVPVVKEKVNFPMPPCPISKTNIAKSFSVNLPAKSPVPINVKVKGTVTVNDGAADILVVSITGSLDKDTAEVTSFAKRGNRGPFGKLAKNHRVKKYEDAAKKFQKLMREKAAANVAAARAHAAQRNHKNRVQSPWARFFGHHKQQQTQHQLRTNNLFGANEHNPRAYTPVEGVRKVHD